MQYAFFALLLSTQVSLSVIVIGNSYQDIRHLKKLYQMTSEHEIKIN